jgi:16S rRNA (cytidine1402-2'-O)-methyltransferase
MNTGKLYLVATPIGNLEDITLRAIRILKEVDIIACEDTRHTKILVDQYSIPGKPMLSFYSYNQFSRMGQIVDELKSGKNIALVCDSGTPGISDPGSLLVKKVIEHGITVESIPGPTAIIAALVCSGLDTNGFVFLGFLPKKPGKIRKILTSAVSLEKTVVFYESPYRILKTLELCNELFAGLNMNVKYAVARELTKKFEEYIRGDYITVYESLSQRKDIKGELVILLSPNNQTSDSNSE